MYLNKTHLFLSAKKCNWTYHAGLSPKACLNKLQQLWIHTDHTKCRMQWNWSPLQGVRLYSLIETLGCKLPNWLFKRVFFFNLGYSWIFRQISSSGCKVETRLEFSLQLHWLFWRLTIKTLSIEGRIFC